MTHPENGPWLTPGLVTRLIELHGLPDLLPYGKIAELLSAEFGISLTRFSVVGKIFRLKLPRRNYPPGFPYIKRPPQPAKETIIMPIEPMPELAPVESPPLPSIDIYCRSIGQEAIAALEPHHCRWPSGEWPNLTFCCRQKYDGESYCKAHCKEAYHGGWIEKND